MLSFKLEQLLKGVLICQKNGLLYNLNQILIIKQQKIKYSYLLTPKDLREKSLITGKFLVRKKIEFEALRDEINSLEEVIKNHFDVHYEFEYRSYKKGKK